MSRLRPFALMTLVAIVALLSFGAATASAASLTDEERLGKSLFFDKNLSDPAGQACAACHAPKVGWTGPSQATNQAGAVYEGAVAGRFGNRKPPAAAYGGDSPVLHLDAENGWVGGMFWDGRATGATLGDPLAEQAMGPFLNPLEQNLANEAAAVAIVKASAYASLFEQVWGSSIWNDDHTAYVAIARSIATYERSSEVSAYSSKYDAYKLGKAKLTAQESRGMKLFFGEAKCGNCHNGDDFTDFTYDNLGVPRNPKNPFYKELTWNPAGDGWVDPGLGGALKGLGQPASVYTGEWGKFKVPTLRNVDLRPTGGFVKAYGHNGYFKSLDEIVHFYNTRDVEGARWRGKAWPEPEVSANVNTTEVGDLGLSAGDEKSIVAFLHTLNDGYMK